MPTSDRLAIVTGSSSGIGRAVAQQLLTAGWRVLGVARRTPDISHPAYRHLTLDLADLPAMTAAFERDLAPMLRDAKPSRVGLVNNAAVIGRTVTIDQSDPAELLTAYAINVVAPTWLMGFVIRHAPRTAAVRIVNVSSGAALRANAGMGEYSGTKAALRMMSMVAAADLASQPLAGRASSDIAVTSYSPGIVDTAMQVVARSQSDDVFPSAPMFKQWHAQGALAPPDVPAAEIVEFLTSTTPPPFAERRRGE